MGNIITPNNFGIVNRYERKFLLTDAQAILVEKKIKQILQRDLYGDKGSYTVRSLYFDNYNNSDFYEKDNGIENRKKIRARIYTTEDEECKLEEKVKHGDLQTKISIKLERQETIDLINGNTGVLLNGVENTDDKRKLFYTVFQEGLYRPVTLIEYDRTAYVYSQYQTRITFDRNVRFKEYENNLFADNINFWPALNGYTILEVKYNKKLIDFISNILRQFKLTQTAVSKYCICRPSLNN